jgi:hypothetical protein
LKDVEEAKDAVQSELDDLLIVFSDLEEKLAQYKVGDQSFHCNDALRERKKKKKIIVIV